MIETFTIEVELRDEATGLKKKVRCLVNRLFSCFRLLRRPFVAENREDVRNVEIDVDCEYTIENNGIGAYEYWGCKGVDRGTDCAVIENTKWDTNGFTKEEIDLINLQIEKKLNDWEDAIIERVADHRVDFDCSSDQD